jgi:hypothetical protein
MAMERDVTWYQSERRMVLVNVFDGEETCWQVLWKTDPLHGHFWYSLDMGQTWTDRCTARDSQSRDAFQYSASGKGIATVFRIASEDVVENAFEKERNIQRDRW